MEKILIIGSNGFIGSHLSAYLKEKGFDIYGCGTAAEPLLNIKYFQVDSLSKKKTRSPDTEIVLTLFDIVFDHKISYQSWQSF